MAPHSSMIAKALSDPNINTWPYSPTPLPSPFRNANEARKGPMREKEDERCSDPLCYWEMKMLKGARKGQ